MKGKVERALITKLLRPAPDWTASTSQSLISGRAAGLGFLPTVLAMKTTVSARMKGGGLGGFGGVPRELHLRG